MFENCVGEISSVDLVCVSPGTTLFMCSVKDFLFLWIGVASFTLKHEKCYANFEESYAKYVTSILDAFIVSFTVLGKPSITE